MDSSDVWGRRGFERVWRLRERVEEGQLSLAGKDSIQSPTWHKDRAANARCYNTGAGILQYLHGRNVDASYNANQPLCWANAECNAFEQQVGSRHNPWNEDVRGTVSGHGDTWTAITKRLLASKEVAIQNIHSPSHVKGQVCHHLEVS